MHLMITTAQEKGMLSSLQVEETDTHKVKVCLRSHLNNDRAGILITSLTDVCDWRKDRELYLMFLIVDIALKYTKAF